MSSSKSRSKRKKSKQTTQFNWLWLLAGLAVIIIVGGVIYAGLQNGNTPDAMAQAVPSEITVDEAHAKYQEGTFLLDVRQPEEWEEYHVPGTTLIPLGELENRLDELPQDQEIVVVCRSGNRSQSGRDILRNAGFDQSTSMTGGLKAWSASGYPTVSGP